MLKISLAFLLISVGVFANSVEFLAIGNPAMLKIQGRCTGKIAKSDKITDKSGRPGMIMIAEVDLNTCDTGISLRNKHMKEKYLEISKYPKATLEVSLFGPGKTTGKLTVHGVEKQVEVFQSGSEITMEAKISDFKIDVPSFMGVTVADEVKIKASLDP